MEWVLLIVLFAPIDSLVLVKLTEYEIELSLL